MQLYLAAAGLRKAGDKEDAAFFFLAAQLRAQRQTIVDKNGDARQVHGLYLGVIGQTVMPAIESDPAMATRATQRALEWDRATPDPFREREEAKTADNAQKLRALEASLAELPKKLRADPARVTKARNADADVERMIARNRAEVCAPGRLDPADFPTVTEHIKRDAERFVASHPFVLSYAQGRVRSVATVSSGTRGGGHQLPHVLTVYVDSPTKRFSAVVSVQSSVSPNRKLESATFTLQCLTSRYSCDEEGAVRPPVEGASPH